MKRSRPRPPPRRPRWSPRTSPWAGPRPRLRSTRSPHRQTDAAARGSRPACPRPMVCSQLESIKRRRGSLTASLGSAAVMCFREVMTQGYVHGYDHEENSRLGDQAGTLVELLHADTAYPAGSLVLEAGCGVGAQTVTLAERSPGARFTSIDVSAGSLAQAQRRVERAGLRNVEFRQADIHALPFADGSFDHVFVCFVLEHLPRPVEALTRLRVLLRPGGTITVIEGDHGSAYFHPDSAAARAAIQCQVHLPALAGGNALVGRQVHPLLVAAGFDAVRVSPRWSTSTRATQLSSTASLARLSPR